MDYPRKSFINVIMNKFIQVVDALTILLMTFMTVIVFLEVLSRYFFNFPFAFSGELTAILFPWVIFMGAIIVTKNDGHLSITHFRGLLRSKYQKLLIIIGKIVMLFFSFYMFLSSIELANSVSAQKFPVLQISMNWLYLSGVFAFIGMSVVLIYQLILLVKNSLKETGKGV
ncbi:TRAP transporter small permease [Anaerobacillus alkalilacustris]|nr:TRAP transporter small permease [Anaerobacillus alkalilacustris]